jgi:hypothetical protein
MAWNWELRIGSWGLGAEDWAWSWGSQEESETDAVDVRGKSSQTALLQTDTYKGSGSLGGLWGLGAGSWQLAAGNWENTSLRSWQSWGSTGGNFRPQKLRDWN